MILVVGSTGWLGGEICKRLRERGDPVRGLVRPGSPKEQALADRGVEVAHGDLKQPAGLEDACRGVETVISTASATISRRRGDTLKAVDRDGQLALVRAAVHAGVRRFVFVSVSPNLTSDCVLVRYKREVERALRDSGLEWTILQPSAFMEGWLGPPLGWEVEKGRARVYGPGEAPISYVSLRNVADFAVMAAHDSCMSGRAIPLGGPEPISQLQAVRIFESVTGRSFSVQRTSTVVPRLLSAVLRPFNPVISSLMGLAVQVSQGDRIDMGPLLAEFPVELTSVREHVQWALARSSGATA